MYELDFTTSADHFIGQAGDYLARHPVLENVVATTADRAVQEDAEGVVRPADRPWWFLTIRDRTRVAGVAMRTAPGPEHAVWAGMMPDDAATQLATELVRRDEGVRMITGSQRPAELIASHLGRLTSGTVSVRERTRLFELGELAPPTGVSGSLRPATVDDLDLVHRWREEFLAAAEERAGRPAISDHTSNRAKDPAETGGAFVIISSGCGRIAGSWCS